MLNRCFGSRVWVITWAWQHRRRWQWSNELKTGRESKTYFHLQKALKLCKKKKKHITFLLLQTNYQKLSGKTQHQFLISRVHSSGVQGRVTRWRPSPPTAVALSLLTLRVLLPQRLLAEFISLKDWEPSFSWPQPGTALSSGRPPEVPCW